MVERMPYRSAEQHVLCVDDDLEFLTSLEFFLPEQINALSDEIRFRFLFMDDPVDALQCLREVVDAGETVALIMSDQKMPKMSGIELLTESRVITQSTIRVLLTGDAGLESAIEAINERLLDKYLTKPIEDGHDFVVTIQHLLERFQMKRAIGEQNVVLQQKVLELAVTDDELREEIAIRKKAEEALRNKEAQLRERATDRHEMVDEHRGLVERLFDSEDSFTERKPQDARDSEIRQTVVAFANSAPPERPGLLLLGVADDGVILGVENTEKLQKRVREICHEQCFPPINYSAQVFDRDAKKVVAITVSGSAKSPHFAGHAFTRVGPDNRKTSEETLRGLITARADLGRVLLDHVGTETTVNVVGKKLGEVTSARHHRKRHNCTILEVNPHYVRLRDEATGNEFVEDLLGIRLSRDLERDRPRLVIRPLR